MKLGTHKDPGNAEQILKRKKKKKRMKRKMYVKIVIAYSITH